MQDALEAVARLELAAGDPLTDVLRSGSAWLSTRLSSLPQQPLLLGLSVPEVTDEPGWGGQWTGPTRGVLTVEPDERETLVPALQGPVHVASLGAAPPSDEPLQLELIDLPADSEWPCALALVTPSRASLLVSLTLPILPCFAAPVAQIRGFASPLVSLAAHTRPWSAGFTCLSAASLPGARVACVDPHEHERVVIFAAGAGLVATTLHWDARVPEVDVMRDDARNVDALVVLPDLRSGHQLLVLSSDQSLTWIPCMLRRSEAPTARPSASELSWSLPRFPALTVEDLPRVPNAPKAASHAQAALEQLLTFEANVRTCFAEPLMRLSHECKAREQALKSECERLTRIKNRVEREMASLEGQTASLRQRAENVRS
jgi:hypothetical protein